MQRILFELLRGGSVISFMLCMCVDYNADNAWSTAGTMLLIAIIFAVLAFITYYPASLWKYLVVSVCAIVAKLSSLSNRRTWKLAVMYDDCEGFSDFFHRGLEAYDESKASRN